MLRAARGAHHRWHAGAATPWTSLAVNDAPEDFHFVVVTDRTGGHREGVFPSAMPRVNLLEPAFVTSVGDLIEGYTEDQAQLDKEWDEIEGFVSELETPFFYAVGNHDMNNAVMARTWQDRFGPSYYYFLYKDVLFLVLNSELFGMVGREDTPVPGPWTQAEQMAFVEKVLAKNSDPRWTIVLVHQPLWDLPTIDEDWLRVEELLGARDYTVFAGHFHRYTRHIRRDRRYITLATTGGGSALRGPAYGEFDHVAWVSMTDEGPRIANLLLSGILSEEVATPESLATVAQLDSAVTVVASYERGDSFTRGRVTLEIANPGDAVLVATPSFDDAPRFEVRGATDSMSVDPGKSVRLEIALEADSPLSFNSSIAAGMSRWTLATTVNGNPVAKDIAVPVVPQKRFQVSRATTAVQLDGALGEWGELPYSVNAQGDPTWPVLEPEDLSYRFGLSYDEEFLYIAVDVRDDSVFSSSERGTQQQDFVAVEVDAGTQEERGLNETTSQAVKSGRMVKSAIAMVTLVPALPTKNLAFLEKTRSRNFDASVRTERGYSMEIAIPGDVLDERQGKPWTAFRLQLSVNDHDEGQADGSHSLARFNLTPLHWQPSRYGSAPLAGSGEFVRADGVRR